MKFICEQCKAKYQIDDAKVAGKTVRMKCRKCGHNIEVRASVTETSVATAAPKDDADRAHGQSSPATSGLATSFASARPNALRVQTSALPSSSGVVPRPGGRQASAGIPKVEGQGALAAAFQRGVREGDGGSEPASQSGQEPRDSLGLSSTDEWYVAINGVPVGPIRVAEVRRKAAGGGVTEDSLAWQEGLDEWRPVRAFPELAAVVREAATAGRSSLLPNADGRVSQSPAAPVVRSSAPPRAVPARPAPPAPRVAVSTAPRAFSPVSSASRDFAQASASPRAPDVRPSAKNSPSAPPVREGQARSNVVPIASRLATAERLDEAPFVPTPQPSAPIATPDPFAPMAGVDPFAMPPPPPEAGAGRMGAGGANAAPSGAQVGFMVASAVPAAPFSPPVSDAQSRRSTPPWMAIAMIVLAATFGITAAVVIFFRPRSGAAPLVVQFASPNGAKSVATGTAEPIDPNTPLPPGTNADGTPRPVFATNGKLPSGASAAPSASAAAPSLGLDTSGLGGATTLSGDIPGSTRPGGQCYSDGQLMGIINQHQGGVRKVCWERTISQKSAANISVTVSIGTGGNVENVSAGGDDSIVASCVQAQVRSWSFPPMGCSQKASFGYKFVR